MQFIARLTRHVNPLCTRVKCCRRHPFIAAVSDHRRGVYTQKMARRSSGESNRRQFSRTEERLGEEKQRKQQNDLNVSAITPSPL